MHFRLLRDTLNVNCDVIYSSTLDYPWVAFNQSYFQLVSDALTFENARKVCQEKKGDLASTSSEEEQTFLYETFMKRE